MMHSSSSVGTGPYAAISRPARPADDGETGSSNNRYDPEKEVAEEFGQLLPHVQEADVTPQQQQQQQQNPQAAVDGKGGGWSELSLERAPSDDENGRAISTPEDDYSFEPLSSSPAAAGDVIVDNDGHENDYVWGPQHLLSGGRYYEYAANSGRHIASSLRSLLPGVVPTSVVDDSAQDVIKSKQDKINNGDANLQPSQQPAKSGLPYTLAAEPSRATSRLDSYSVHTETYIFGSEFGDIVSADGDGGDVSSLFSREASSVLPDFDEESFETAKEGAQSVEASLVDDDDDDSSGGGTNNAEPPLVDTRKHDEEESKQATLNFSRDEGEVAAAEQQQLLQLGDALKPSEPHKTTLRSEVIEILQEDIGKVNDAFLETLHKTSELVHPVGDTARSGTPIRQRLHGISQSLSQRAIGVTRSVSESASAAIPSNLGERSTQLLQQAHRAEEAVASSASEALSRVHLSLPSSSPGEALSRVHVPAIASSIVSASVNVIEGFDDAVEALRVDDTDVCDDAEILSSLTAGAYA